MDLFLIRHGESCNNALEDASLRVADPELTEKGTAQIARVAECIGAGLHLYPGERDDGRPGLDQLYCSAMIRACHTAQPIGRALGLAPEVWLDIHEIGGIYLDHGGDRGKVGYPGQTRGEIAARFSETIADAVAADGWWQGTAETPAAAQGRTVAVAAALLARAEENTRIGLVTHGGFMSLLLKALANGLPGHRFCHEYEHDNTAITRVAIAPRDIVVEYVNRIEHLPDELRMPRRLPVV